MISLVLHATGAVFLSGLANGVAIASEATSDASGVTTSPAATSTAVVADRATVTDLIRDALNPYNTVSHPFNVQPSNPSLASMCSKSFITAYDGFYATAINHTGTYPAQSAIRNSDSATITKPASSYIYYEENFSWVCFSPFTKKAVLFH